MDRPDTPGPVGFVLIGLWGVVVALYVQRWSILLGILFGIALCHWVPWLCGLDLRPPE